MLIIFDACAKIYCQLRCQSYIVEVNKFTIIHTSENLVCNNYLIFFIKDCGDNDECSWFCVV